ncbi:Aspercryptin biosynthesis cluster-specific transcription regulator atnN [Colletotrichum fructicola]|uniref:C6 zinc finger domain protein n=1 Tax=Colletotrichum fructicola (strain Nara gc5) TaxID=1213859 RepID=L2FX57_COLFN|nr:Aspercryptin biosynthesis cluster-specific transcription regulator atnN [Colletotrichum fructicola]KAF4910066.1 Aspercryptin biosynthesis cluster-specific transcription regulator atnN [Colletotrichum fructicola]KAF4933086.1 Aspercryptin biosynthesis cluster-specific transcription regulator atnN [Colletotrichum fructicola]
MDLAATQTQSHFRRLGANDKSRASAPPARHTISEPQTVSTSTGKQMTDPDSTPQASLQLPAPSSGRKGSKKVRTGCVTIRKVKCDETKPACLRCTKTGRNCDGYFPQKAASSNDDAGSPGPEVARLNPPISPFADWAGGSREQRAFDFYRNFSAPAIFSDGSGGSTLWKKLVPHFCHAEPSIRHAVLAISSLHESLSQEKSADAGDTISSPKWAGVLSNTFASEQYGKALKHLQEWKPSESAGVTVPLLACLLFICVEFMLGDERASQVHINQGRLILAQLDSSIAGNDVSVIKKHFVPIYSRLSLASFLFGSNPAEIPSNLRSSSATNLYFASVDEAEVALYELIDDGLRFSNMAKGIVYSRPTDDPQLQTLQQQQGEILAKFNRWHVAFTVISAVEDAKRAGKLCLLYYHTAKIWISTAMSPLETAYDDHIASFAAIIHISAELVHSSKKYVRDPSKAAMSTPKFVFDTEVIPPLYYTITKCRHPMLRRAAADLLKQEAVTKRRENLWDAHMSVEIGKRIIAIEEDTVRRDAPDFGTMNWDAISWTGSEELANFQAPAAGFPSDTSVPCTQRPWISRETNHMLNEKYEAVTDIARSRQTTPGSVSAGSSTGSLSSNTSWGSMHLEAPFNLPEFARVKNVLIDNETAHGSWLTLFMDPEEAGAQSWKVTKEFVRA